MAKTELLLWDWNGTLLNDVDLCLECLNLLLGRHGYPQHYDYDSYRRIFGFPIEDYYREAGFDFDKDPYADLAEEFMAHYVPHSEACPLFDDARSTLEEVERMGIPQVILSASPVTLLREQVVQRDVPGFFSQLLGLGDIYAHSKVDIGVDFMHRAGMDPARVVLVGDSVHDFQVAQAMGTRCILCAAGHQCREKLEQTGAPVIDHLSQLPALL